MIIDLERFLNQERSAWAELEAMLDRLEAEPGERLSLHQLRHFHELYERASAALAKITTFSAEPQTRRYLEILVARAYAEIHETRGRRQRFRFYDWLSRELPQTFRRNVRAFWLSLAITMVGCLFGGLAIGLDPDSKPVLMPFAGLMQDPAKRVAQEEKADHPKIEGNKAPFAAELMTHNIKVSILTLALGMTFGLGTIIMLFYNGVILGAVAVDYLRAGQAKFLFGWLLPHGAIEIPSILIAGQAGLLLAGALIGWGRRVPLAQRLREISRELLTLIGGFSLLLVWAGFVESFLSQYHEPVLPYAVKIAFGLFELGLLTLFLAKSGSKPAPAAPPP